MKLFFMSDIHGSIYWLNKALEKFQQENADYIVILGDVLYHGPRNLLPQDYNPKAVAEAINQYKDKIIAVRGNCDGEVDQMVLDFPILSDYTILFYEGKRIFATHGHKFSMDKLPNIADKDIFIQGHTHLPVAQYEGGKYLLNPGSITLPKENNPNSYGVLYKNEFVIKDFDENTIKKITIDF